MKFRVSLAIDVEADSSFTALAFVLANVNTAVGDIEASVDPDDGSVPDEISTSAYGGVDG